MIKEQVQNRFGKYFTSPKTEPAPSIPSVQTKPTITPTPLTETKPEYVYKPPTQEELDRVFGVAPATSNSVTTPEQTESKSPEKKEDVWAGIRGMRDCDKMIADLETGGITSLDDLKGFFWNTHHADNHSVEIADLKKKYTAIDKLITMIKQRSQHSATYKEYQDRSALTQKHFRKKNAAAIDAYEEADKYITEHIKTYYTRANRRSRAICMLRAMLDLCA